MYRTDKYTIILWGKTISRYGVMDIHELTRRHADTMKESKTVAKYLMSSEYARSCETDDLNWIRCDINDITDQCIIDYWRD